MTNKNFKIIPAIDVYKNGNLVRLKQGDFAGTQTKYAFTPAEKIREYLCDGYERLHTVDLAGAEGGTPANIELFKALGAQIRAHEKKSGKKIIWQVGGGVRTAEDVRRVFGDYGADMVILGAAAIDREVESGFLSELVEEFGAENFILDIAVGTSSAHQDARMLKKNGWKDDVAVPFTEALELIKKAGITKTLVTAKELDGMDSGPGFSLGQEVKKFGFEVILSGGVGTIADCILAAQYGLDGVVIGKAMLDGKINALQIKSAINNI